MPKQLSVIAFDFKGRRVGTYPTFDACSKETGVNRSTLYKLVQTGRALKRNGMTFDVEDRKND